MNDTGELVEAKLDKDFATKDEALEFANALLDATFSVNSIEKDPLSVRQSHPLLLRPCNKRLRKTRFLS